MAATLVAAAVGISAASSHDNPPIVFGPEHERYPGLPQWIASAGSAQCFLEVPPGEDHGAYYELEGRAEQNGIRARYGAGIEGLPNGAEPPEETEPVVVNGVQVRLEGLTVGETYTIREPHGVFDGMTFVADDPRLRIEEEGADPQRGPVTDLTITGGEFRLLRGGPDGEAVVSFPLEHLCGSSDGGDVAPAPPVARFTYDCGMLTRCTFDGRMSIDPDGGIVHWAWDFGDGTSATGATARHTYVLEGTYSVTLTVTDEDGLTDTITMDVRANLVTLPPVPLPATPTR